VGDRISNFEKSDKELRVLRYGTVGAVGSMHSKICPPSPKGAPMIQEIQIWIL